MKIDGLKDFSVRIPVELHRELSVYCAAMRITKKDFTRQAIIEALKGSKRKSEGKGTDGAVKERKRAKEEQLAASD
jgi:hypothetical protein